MIAVLCSVIALGLTAAALTGYLMFQQRDRRRKPDCGNVCRRVVREEIPACAGADRATVQSYRRILEKPSVPSARLLKSMTKEEETSYAALATSRTLVVAHATHPHRRNAILNLIEACEEEFLVVVGEYTQGLYPKHGVVLPSFGAERFAAFIFDGALTPNPRFLRLSSETPGVTVGGAFYRLPEFPLAPYKTERFTYAIDPYGPDFTLTTCDRTKFVFCPEDDVVSVSVRSGRVRVETVSGEFYLTVTGTKVSARPVWCGRVGVRVLSKTAATVTRGERDGESIRRRCAEFFKKDLLADYEADETTNRLKAFFEPIMTELLRYRRTGRIESVTGAAAVTAGSFEDVPLTALKVPGEEYGLSAAMLLCAKSYRGKALDDKERDVLRQAAKEARESAGLIRAFTFKLMGLLNDVDRAALKKEFVSLAVDAIGFAHAAQALPEPERALAIALFSGAKLPSVRFLSENADRISVPGKIAAYLLIRVRLLGVRLREGRLYCEPRIPTLKSLTIAGKTIDVRRGEEACVTAADGIRYYTTILPARGNFSLVTDAQADV